MANDRRSDTPPNTPPKRKRSKKKARRRSPSSSSVSSTSSEECSPRKQRNSRRMSKKEILHLLDSWKEENRLISAEVQNMDMLRMLMERPQFGGLGRWDRRPRIEDRLEAYQRKYDEPRSYDREFSTSKRSAVATALNAGRPRRQPAPAIGKAVTRFPGVGILSDMDTFFEALRGNLQGMASLTPNERATFYEPPSVVQAQPSGGSGGSGMRKLHALRPLRPAGNVRSYNRRSLVEDHVYPGANSHDPGLLWAGLGR